MNTSLKNNEELNEYFTLFKAKQKVSPNQNMYKKKKIYNIGRYLHRKKEKISKGTLRSILMSIVENGFFFSSSIVESRVHNNKWAFSRLSKIVSSK